MFIYAHGIAQESRKIRHIKEPLQVNYEGVQMKELKSKIDILAFSIGFLTILFWVIGLKESLVTGILSYPMTIMMAWIYIIIGIVLAIPSISKLSKKRSFIFSVIGILATAILIPVSILNTYSCPQIYIPGSPPCDYNLRIVYIQFPFWVLYTLLFAYRISKRSK